MLSLRNLSLWACVSVGVAAVMLSGSGAALAQQSSSMGSLSETPPLKQTVTYVGKTTTTDFSAPGMGAHLQYFPAFGLSAPESALRTDCETCLELTPDFENFKHHVPIEVSDRTFSPDAPGQGEFGEPGYIPEGVKTSGGNSSWDTFTLPDGTVGLSGTAYDPHTCDGSGTFVNQIRINSSDLQDFCLNIVTDNTAGQHDPNSRLVARSDDVNAELDATHPDLTFDGQADMYTFRYMGMQEGDRVKIRIGDASGASCSGPGVGGIMISDISTCTPAPEDMCVPNCSGLVCGDDGCGGSCGTCPRVDTLRNRRGNVEVTIVDNGSTLVSTDSSVESVITVSDRLQELIDRAETDLANQLRYEMTQLLNTVDVDVRNFGFGIERKLTIDTLALADGNLAGSITTGALFARAKLTPEDDGGLAGNAKLGVTASGLTVSFNFDPVTGAITGVTGGANGLVVDIDTNGPVGLVPGIANLVSDLFALNFDLIEFAQGFLANGLADLLEEELGDLGDELNGFNVQSLATVPLAIDINGVDYAPQIRAGIFNPAVGQHNTIEYDGSTPQIVEADLPIVREDKPTLTVNVGTQFTLVASVRTSTSPPIIGSIDDAFLDANGQYTVSGWTCAQGLPQPLDAGVFSDGFAVQIVNANNVSEPVVGQTCGTDGVYGDFRYSIAPTGAELGPINGWDNEIHVIAGHEDFEMKIGDVPRSRADDDHWLGQSAGPGGIQTVNSVNSNYQYIADFNGDGRDDFMWNWYGWHVALSNGDGFDPPTTWLAAGASPPGIEFSAPSHQFVADFNGDGNADFMWWTAGWGWYVALSNGTTFEAPNRWLIGTDSPTGVAQQGGFQYVGDFNDDGLDDFMWNWNGWYVALSNGSDFEPPTLWLANNAGPGGVQTYNNVDSRHQYVADFNGDGLDDYMWNWYGWHVALSNGNGFDGAETWLVDADSPSALVHPGEPFLATHQFVADYNGDGKSDYMWYNLNWGWFVALSDGTDFIAPTAPWLTDADSPSGFAQQAGYQFVTDFDSDGRDDLMWNWNGWYVALSKGDDFGDPKLWLTNTAVPGELTYSAGFQFVGDFTGNSFPDFLWNYGYTGWRVASTVLPGEPGLDQDDDGIRDLLDNCPVTPNPLQVDSDADGLGNACELACADGFDNDGDGYTDFPDDPGCKYAAWANENPACNDGYDNDKDGLIDYPDDPSCPAAYSQNELIVGCGLGFEIGIVLLPLMWLRHRRRARVVLDGPL